MKRRCLLRLFVASAGSCVATPLARLAAAEPVVSTTGGRLRGFIAGNGTLGFKGIRYGADTSARRFLPPVAPASWPGIRDAVEFGAVAPQPGMRGRAMSEDCLFLNVWTPGLRDGRAPGHGLVPRRRLHQRLGQRAESDGARLAGAATSWWSPSTTASTPSAISICRARRPNFADSGNVGLLDFVLALRVGPRQHRRVRRRPGKCHDLRPVGRRREVRDADGHARRARAVPSRHHDERAADHRRAASPRRPRTHGSARSPGGGAEIGPARSALVPMDQLVGRQPSRRPILGRSRRPVAAARSRSIPMRRRCRPRSR